MLNTLNSELEVIASTLSQLGNQNKAARFVAADKDAALIQKYIIQVDQALVDYQVFCL